MRTRLTVLVLALSLVPVAPAQIEVNTAGGSLTSNGLNPMPGGGPFVLTTSDDLNFEIGGTPLTPYALLFGTYTSSGIVIPALGGEIFNLDVTQPISVVGDGSGGLPGVLPPAFFVLDAQGRSDWSLPLSPALGGARFAFQAIVPDAAIPGGTNLTAAAEFAITTVTVIDVLANLIPTVPSVPAADEGVFIYTPVTPLTVYGQTVTQLVISSNGWVRLDGNVFDADPTVNEPDFLAGITGFSGGATAPIIAPFWDDLEFSTGAITITEDPAGPTLTIQWSGGTVSGVGSVGMTLVFNGLDIMMSYPSTLLTPGSSIIGISDGNLMAGAADIEFDLLVGGSGGLPFPTSGAVSLYQDFAAGSTPELEDVAGRTLQFLDLMLFGPGSFLYIGF